MQQLDSLEEEDAELKLPIGTLLAKASGISREVVTPRLGGAPLLIQR